MAPSTERKRGSSTGRPVRSPIVLPHLDNLEDDPVSPPPDLEPSSRSPSKDAISKKPKMIAKPKVSSSAKTTVQVMKSPKVQNLFGDLKGKSSKESEYDIYEMRIEHVNAPGDFQRLGAQVRVPKTAMGGFEIISIEPGLFFEHNKNNPDDPVMPGDIIASVNGECSDIEEMVKALTRAQAVDFTLQRKRAVAASVKPKTATGKSSSCAKSTVQMVQKTPVHDLGIRAQAKPTQKVYEMIISHIHERDKFQKLGADVRVLSGKPAGFEILGFKPGLMQDYNDAHPDNPVKIGDTITSVNDLVDDAGDMLMELTTCKDAKITVVRG